MEFLLVCVMMLATFLAASVFMSDDIRNARADAVESTIGTTAILRIYSGTIPANEGATLGSAVLIAEITLPSDWMSNASGGVKAKSGTWQDTSADATGTAAFWRIYESTGTTSKFQGDITATGGGGSMTVDSTSFTAGQQFTVNSFGWTEAH